MKTIFCILILACAAVATQAAEPKPNSSEALAHIGLMRVQFRDFYEVLNPETKRNEYVFKLIFVDINIPGGPLEVRRGNKVVGYTIGTFIKREPHYTATDSLVPGTLSTLEIINNATGEKYILEMERICTIAR
jgi:hypothetical protein